MREPSAATTLRRYADYAIRHKLKFKDGWGNEIEVGPTIIDVLDYEDVRTAATRLREHANGIEPTIEEVLEVLR